MNLIHCGPIIFFGLFWCLFALFAYLLVFIIGCICIVVVCHCLCYLSSPLQIVIAFVADHLYYLSSPLLLVITLATHCCFCCWYSPYYLSSLLLFIITLLFIIALLVITLCLSSPFLFILAQLLNIVFLFIIALLFVVTHTFKLGTNTTSTYCLVIHHHLVAHFTSPFFVVMILRPHLQCACYLQLEHYGVCNNDSLCTSKRWDFIYFWFICWVWGIWALN